ncbi:MAG: hypothetical protein H6Q38_2322 [Chloroflexi bacterium]|nr:hypothetical protein [Chloroflexota bacterium]
MQSEQAHELLFVHLAAEAGSLALGETAAQLEALLLLPEEGREAQAAFRWLAAFIVEALKRRPEQKSSL